MRDTSAYLNNALVASHVRYEAVHAHCVYLSIAGLLHCQPAACAPGPPRHMSPGATFPAAARRAATPYRLMLAHLARGAYASPVQAEGGTPGLLAQGRPEAKAKAGTFKLLEQGPSSAMAEGGSPRSPTTPAWAGAGTPAFPYTVTPAGAHSCATGGAFWGGACVSTEANKSPGIGMSRCAVPFKQAVFCHPILVTQRLDKQLQPDLRPVPCQHDTRHALQPSSSSADHAKRRSCLRRLQHATPTVPGLL